MQFTGHSLPVHQSMTVPQDLTLFHFVSQAHPHQWNMQFRRLWNGMFGRVKGQYITVLHTFNCFVFPAFVLISVDLSLSIPYFSDISCILFPNGLTIKKKIFLTENIELLHFLEW